MKTDGVDRDRSGGEVDLECGLKGRKDQETERTCR